MKKSNFIVLLAPFLLLSACATYYQTEIITAESVEVASPSQEAFDECEGIIQKNTLAMVGPNLVIDGDTYGTLMRLCLENRGFPYRNLAEVRR